MEISQLLKDHRSRILAVASELGVKNIRIFGSVARGESDNQSDIDFLVEPEPGFTLLKHAALIRKLEGLLGRQVDVVSDKGIRPRLRERILKEAVPL